MIERKTISQKWKTQIQHEIEVTCITPIMTSEKKVDLYTVSVQAGEPTPADESKEGRLDLNAHLVGDPQNTFFVRVSGHSMIDAGIHDGDLLIVDRQKPVVSGRIIIAVVNGDLTVKRIYMGEDKIILCPENPDFSAIEISNDNDFMTLGVVTNVIHSL